MFKPLQIVQYFQFQFYGPFLEHKTEDTFAYAIEKVSFAILLSFLDYNSSLEIVKIL